MIAIVSTIFILIAVVFSIILHEIAHGVAALQFDDTTARDKGRITLNPLPHIDPLGSIVVPLFGLLLGGFVIAWAKPVPVNFLRLKPYRLGMFCVAVAGVATNLFIAVCVAMLARVFLAQGQTGIVQFLAPVVFINIILGFFNLLPIPPLDGSKVLYTVLNFSSERQQRIEMMLGGFTGFFIIIMLMMFGVLSPVFHFAYSVAQFLLLG